MRAFFAIVSLIALSIIMSGCSSIETYNVTVSKSTYQIASGIEKKDSILERYALLNFITEDKTRISFNLHEISCPNDIATATIDKSSSASFFVIPGTYCFQNNTKIDVSAGEVIHFMVSSAKTKKISIYEYKSYGMQYLTKLCSGTDKIIPAHIIVPDLVGSGYRFGWYTGKTVMYTIASPFYVLYGVAYLLGSGAKGAMNSGSPPYMLGGALVYALTFWAVTKENTNTNPAGEANIYFNKKSPNTFLNQSQTNSSNVNQVMPNVYGPGIGQDQFGRPTQYVVPNWPANEPTQNLQVKPDVYGPGIGQDQFGRPVTTKTAF